MKKMSANLKNKANVILHNCSVSMSAFKHNEPESLSNNTEKQFTVCMKDIREFVGLFWTTFCSGVLLLNQRQKPFSSTMDALDSLSRVDDFKVTAKQEIKDSWKKFNS